MEKLEFLKNLGMNEYESKVLNTLIKLRKAEPKEISLDSGVPQNKLYAILKKFIDFGILAILPLKTKKYELINFKEFINNKIKEKENLLRELKKNSFKVEILKEKEEQGIFSLIKGQGAVMNKIAEENSKVEKEILGVQRNWHVWGEGLREMEKAVKRGVKVKQIGIVNNETIKKVNEWKKTGIEIRKFNEKFGDYPLRFSIFDGKFARITIGKPEIKKPEDYITIWTDSKSLIKLLRNQFMQMWRGCERI